MFAVASVRVYILVCRFEVLMLLVCWTDNDNHAICWLLFT